MFIVHVLFGKNQNQNQNQNLNQNLNQNQNQNQTKPKLKSKPKLKPTKTTNETVNNNLVPRPVSDAVGYLLDPGRVEVVELQQRLSPLPYMHRRAVRLL